MVESTASLSGIGVAMGLVFGVALGTAAAVVFDVPTATVAGYSTGGGLVVGAGAGRLAEANVAESDLDARILGGSTLFGVVVGTGIGGLTAWTVDASLLAGAAVGVFVGMAHGLLLGSVLLGTLRRRASAKTDASA